ncbi:DUF2786 domain-containing protein [Aquibium oceanicum]|uniref:Uncharacterized protein n=1 Tax=Aquibium oceanicum TaxID=1670800 RepID=A0A1L3SXI7_9HYPH|nr:DUF2786 domain-containing protein [Aquibium oceanicum]APH74143.1 hypothetical protein BSQ44_24300 [Aquibium oceanicum]
MKRFEVRVIETRAYNVTYTIDAENADYAITKAEIGDTIHERTTRCVGVIDRTVEAESITEVGVADEELKEFIKGAHGIVEANSFEYHQLYRNSRTGRFWEENLSGIGRTIGHIDDKPVHVSLRRAFISGRRIVFIDATSQVVDHEMVREWLKRVMPATAFESSGRLNMVDANNFHNVVPMNTELNKVKARIRALSLKTTAHGCTEQEALAAMDKVAELLEVYNLTMSEALLAEETCVEATIDLQRVTRPRWVYIFSTIAAFTQTRAWSNMPDIHFFGYEPDVQLAVYLSETILKAFHTEAKRFRETSPYRWGTIRSKRRLLKAWQLGFFGRLDERLRPMVPQGKGLVLVKQTKVSEELQRLKPNLKLKRCKAKAVRVNAAAYHAGREVGDRVNLNRPLAGAKPDQLLLT